MRLTIKPENDTNDPRDEIYRKVVDCLPDEAKTIDVVQSISMVLAAILIEQTKNKENRVAAAKMICDKIMEACETVPSKEELDAKLNVTDSWKTRH